MDRSIEEKPMNGHAHRDTPTPVVVPPATEVQAEAAPATVQIEDLDSFVRHLSHWHQHQLTIVNHLLQVPVGAVFQVGDDVELKMTQEVLAGFKLGIELTLSHLGTLPFLAEVQDTGTPEAATEGSDSEGG